MDQWRFIQRKNFTQIDDIADFLHLDDEKKSLLFQKKSFPLQLPERIARKIPKNCINNPLALQFLPIANDENYLEGKDDPVGDMLSRKNNALLHKYEGRALLLTTGACAMHCRYCFRQNYPYKNEVEEALEMVGKEKSIKEIILSGGDPLSLSDVKLEKIINKIEEFDHVKIIRFHTRFLIGIPERISKKFLHILSKSSKQIIFVIHVNCVEELDDDIFNAIKQIKNMSIPVLSQSVLLKGINNNFDSLRTLFWELACCGVIPYYLHHLDRVKGSLHFEVSKQEGISLISKLRDHLPGYAVPNYVEEVQGERSKQVISC